MSTQKPAPDTSRPAQHGADKDYPFGRWIVGNAKLVFVVSLLVAIAATVGMHRLKNNPDNRVFFGENNPQLLTLEALESTYTKTDNIFIALAPEDGNVFTPVVLQAVAGITEQSWQIPHSSRVDSITNYQHTRSEEDDLLVTELVEDPDNLTDAIASEIKKVALSKSFLVNRLISHDATVTGINITILKPDGDQQALYEIVSAAKSMVSDYEASYPQIDFYTTGGTLFDVAFADLPAQENAVLVPLMFGLILFIVGIALRTVWATVSVMILIALSVSSAMGLSGWAGAVLNAGTTGAPVIIPTLAVAHCVHLLVTIRQKMAVGFNQRDAIVEAMRVNVAPIFITSMTTAIGFLSLNFSDAPPFRLLGNIVATGVMVSFVLAVTLLPAFLAMVKLKPRDGPFFVQNVMSRLSNFVVRFQKPLLWGLSGLVIILAFGSTKIVLDDNFIKYFSDKFEIRRHTDFIEQRLTGLNAIEYSIPAKDEGGISDPEYLTGVDNFVSWLLTQPKVTNVGAISDTIKDLNQSMHGDDPAYHRVPESRELAAQYLLLFEMSLPYGLDLNNTIDISKSQSRVIVLLQDASSEDMRVLNARAENWLQENSPALFTHGSGLSMAFAYVSERNIRSMLFGSLIALVSISFILIIALRSLKLGLISLIPNLVPAAMALGIWGYLVGEVGLSVAIVVAVTLGIVVDDTVHFLSKYLRARRERGLSAEQAIEETFQTVGVALWITSAALIAGFGVLYLSGFKVNAEMGILSAVTIAIALLADYFLLPPILLKLDGKM